MSSPQNIEYKLTATWRMNCRLNLRLLDALTEEQLAATLRPRGRAVTSYFVHIHMARFYWLERRARKLAARLEKIPGGAAPRAELRRALVESGKAMEEFFSEIERTGKFRSSNLGPIGFLGYAIAHEAHHRGQILLHLKIAKLPVDKDSSYSLWNWNSKGE